MCLFETFKVSCKDSSLQKVSNKPEISQSLILGHVTTVSTNQNTGNSQIVWDFMRLSQKHFHLKSNAVYNSSAKNKDF